VSSDDREYILGTDPQELDRLRFQHLVWQEHCHRLWRLGGIGAGDAVLDLGCGPGFAALDLASYVGPGGRVIARDQSERFLGWLAQEKRRCGLDWIEPSLGPVETLDLPEGSLTAVYSRWLFCWLRDPEPVFQRMARSLRRGGALLLHEYLDWGTNSLVPAGPAHARAVQACLQSFRESGTIDFSTLVPEFAARAGLEVERFEPIARLGGTRSLEWRWVGGFFGNYLPKLVQRGLLAEAELTAWRDEWVERQAGGASFLQAPTMAAVVLRKR
jgi:SAM-dependent methyltransferase